MEIFLFLQFFPKLMNFHQWIRQVLEGHQIIKKVYRICFFPFQKKMSIPSLPSWCSSQHKQYGSQFFPSWSITNFYIGTNHVGSPYTSMLQVFRTKQSFFDIKALIITSNTASAVISFARLQASSKNRNILNCFLWATSEV